MQSIGQSIVKCNLDIILKSNVFLVHPVALNNSPLSSLSHLNIDENVKKKNKKSTNHNKRVIFFFVHLVFKKWLKAI